jgi:hypothetical protein
MTWPSWLRQFSASKLANPDTEVQLRADRIGAVWPQW